MKKVKDTERRICGKCRLVGDWKIYTDGSKQKQCPHCNTRKAGSQKIS